MSQMGPSIVEIAWSLWCFAANVRTIVATPRGNDTSNGTLAQSAAAGAVLMNLAALAGYLFG